MFLASVFFPLLFRRESILYYYIIIVCTLHIAIKIAGKMIFFVKSEELLKTGFKSALILSKVPGNLLD